MRLSRLSKGRWLLVALTLPIALVALLPLRLAVGWVASDARGLSARGVHGSIWDGTIEQMRVGALPLGTLDAALSPLPLLLGRVRLNLARPANGASALHGTITIGHDRVGVDHLTASLPTAGLLAPLPIGALDVDDASVRFVRGRCDHAEGRVRARLDGALPGVARAQGLTGSIRCDGTRARLALASQSGQERLDLSIGATGDYIADARIAEPDPALEPTLTALGFVRVPGGFRLRTTGALE
ncbi:type II secretion system protein N (GspN) [Hephaestia caeni]|uniref:Type II secretion system protein N n=1 Tax=Hephaestia caeni TaxID=645617 RepID=A0A397PB02_9SPHN|nr:type II secretion system protein N [Hephaestia caeni]RIA45573.1 type II secretion system protein N (GspN) [Hephaestia caeni]